jgi:hypothetical protein
VEAAHVLREVASGSDPNDLVGRVKSRAYLEELGAEIVESSMILGDAAYDVEPGWLGSPTTTFDEHVSTTRNKTRKGKSAKAEEPKTDEDLLANFLVKNL